VIPDKDKVHCVMFSGGISSWAAAWRVRERYPDCGIIALFADTNMEDEDLYRFLDEAADSVGACLIKISDGRTPWEVFRDVRFLGNSRVDPCSKILKRDLLDKWRNDNLERDATILYVGIDWTEQHRYQNVKGRMYPWRVDAPLCEPPYFSKNRARDLLLEIGIQPPRLYSLGFSHNNCGGFCIKAGHAHFANLLRTMPDRYAYHEGKEEEIRQQLGKDVSILVDRAGGTKKPMTLKDFRERITCGEDYDRYDIGGCGCFSGPVDAIPSESLPLT